ncbi:MAG: ABC transporter ATP-binding protein [Bacteroidetes bacterium RIFOXYA12_FULL_35_11]|nr:MAG: ABC transporter ATP-binding protein [Bacteroidetes bacterium GWF2_35_48]OFY74565.1 MAG: ABC transporter ATP-binding protein [Bacteroidetes bacterium RIFOXYA12_FULL_35_11]OFY97131.1 MAG: ABC transporter ATP-binding protein [Bacteroidetes bacterium RIFOXYC12_FULL_35_7]
MYSFFKQPDSMDCGPACIKMIAAHYGKNLSLDKLRDLCFTSKDGVSLLSISDAAENIGFKTTGLKISFKKLKSTVKFPCIAHWNQEHFVVIYKISKKGIFQKENTIIIADPAYGIITLTEEEFCEHWISTRNEGENQGIILSFEPTHVFYKTDSDNEVKNNFKFLFSYFVRYKKYFIQLLIGLLLGSAFQLILPFFTQSIVDIGINTKNINFIYLVLLAQIALTISRVIVNLIESWIVLHISVRINLSLISDFFIKLMKLPIKFFDTKLIGDLLQRIEDHSRVEKFITRNILTILFSALNFIVFGIVLLFYSKKIFLIFLVGSAIYTFWVLAFLKKRKVLDYKFFEVKANNQNKIYQLIYGMQEIKLQNCEKRKRWEWEDIQADLFQVNISSMKLEQIRELGNVFINESKNILITIVAATSVINNEMTLGMMLATQYIIGQVTHPVEQLVAMIYDLQDTKISLDRINEIHRKNDENSISDFKPVNIQEKRLEVKNLVFQYEGPHSKKVLNNITVHIPSSKVTAIVGASGSGKTTLIKLLLQYYTPVSGNLFVDNFNLNEINTTLWRNQCGAVMQDGFIFSETIARNIATSNDDIDTNKLLKAAEIANIKDFIEELPLKYNTIIGQEGQNLSQGQKQRILIARAVYKNPDFLFFDEATNALDANNEKVIVENLQQFYSGKTVIIVAHRLSTVKHADQIIVLSDGEIVETGTHEVLTQKKGAYYNLVKNQLELGN